MKILYLTPRINNEGGVARIVSVKTNLLIESYNHDVAILTQNSGNFPLFFDFNSKLKLFDITLKGSLFSIISSYKKQVKTIIKQFNPDVVIVTDNGLKGYLFPYLIQINKPVLFEVHGSKFNSQKSTNGFIKNSIFKFHVYLREKGLEKFAKVIFLSEESKNQWNVANYEIIPNINWITTSKYANQENNKAICVARNSYEKGLDLLLLIWSKIVQQRPNWKLELFTEKEGYFNINEMISKLNLNASIQVFNFEKDIVNRYADASIYLMTSRDEGMPMVLIEAMSLGLVTIAFDCPIGPKSLIDNNENGCLISNQNTTEFVLKTIELIDDTQKRIDLGKKAIESSKKYQAEPNIALWNNLLNNL